MRRMNGNHGNHTAPSGKNNSHLQAGLATGYLCRRTEEELHTIAAATGGIVTARELGSWMGKFLLSQSEADADGLDHRQRVSQVRGGAPERYALPAGPEAVHVRPRRHLSLKGRRAIAVAQRARWARQKAANAALAKQRAANAAPVVGRGKPRNGVHWTQTPKGRAFMRKTAKSRFGTEQARKPMPDGFWQKETTRMLRAKPRPQREVFEALKRRFPEKGSAISVALATLKHDKVLVEVDGLLTVNGAAA
jgi:hypothetical protein